MVRIQTCLTLALLASAAQAIACTPPTSFTPWPEQVAQAYAQSQAVYIAQAVRRQAGPQKDGYETVRVFLKPIRFFKGGRANALAYIEKAGHTCDQRPVPTERGKVLVFASARGTFCASYRSRTRTAWRTCHRPTHRRCTRCRG